MKAFTPVTYFPRFGNRIHCALYAGETVEPERLPTTFTEVWPAIHAPNFRAARHAARKMFDKRKVCIDNGLF